MNAEHQESSALTIVDAMPVALMRKATDVATVCKDIVIKTACNIQGRKYVKCEGWMAIATAHGCMARSRDVQRIDGGWTAIGEIVRINDGVILSTAEGFVGKDEKKWGNCPEYACRAMAQTRAISRACRAAFAHVVVMMDAGLSTTPAEEVPDGGFEDRSERVTPIPRGTPPVKVPPSIDKLRDRMLEVLLKAFESPVLKDFALKWGAIKTGEGLADWRDDLVPKDSDDMACLEAEVKRFTDGAEIKPVPAPANEPKPTAQEPAPAQERAPDEDALDWRSMVITFGKNKGTTLGELKDNSLRWYVNNYEVKPGTYEKENQKFRDALDAAQEEMQFEPEND